MIGATIGTLHTMNQKVMIVTGGSRGIGAATAQIAATRGYAVCISYRSQKEAADSVVSAILLAGGKALALPVDVASEMDVVTMFQTVDRELGPVTALVNNAGILERQMRIAEMDAARLNRIFATNVTGSFLCAREAIRRMSTKRGGVGGAIVNLSSAASRLGSPGEYVDYAASKGAIDTFTLGLAKEVAAEGIRVNAVRPGVIYTDIHASGGEPGRVERVKESIPMRRGGQPEEVAKAIMWLLSEEASYTTGTLLDVTGGR
jgi:NAD(P)-dependent dehydrogenase (short-subunit alcohol dehydrogenase family)